MKSGSNMGHGRRYMGYGAEYEPEGYDSGPASDGGYEAFGSEELSSSEGDSSPRVSEDDDEDAQRLVDDGDEVEHVDGLHGDQNRRDGEVCLHKTRTLAVGRGEGGMRLEKEKEKQEKGTGKFTNGSG